MSDIDAIVEEVYKSIHEARWGDLKGILRAAFYRVEKETLQWVADYKREHAGAQPTGEQIACHTKIMENQPASCASEAR